MRRMVVLSLLIAAGAASLVVARQAQQPRIIEVEKLRDNLFVLRGGGSNTTVFVQTDGITVVDTKNPGWGASILATIKTLSPKPVTTIINTHTHPDHVSGNVEFPATVDIVVQERTAANMKEMREPPGMPVSNPPPPTIFVQHKGHGLPKRTFASRMTLFSGPDQIELYYFGRGHTDGDAWVLFPSLRVVAAGDIVRGKSIPLLDSSNGGSGLAIGDTIAQAHAVFSKTADIVVTGHLANMTLPDMLEYAQFNREFAAAMRDAKRAGKSVDEAARSWTIPAKYQGYEAPAESRLRSNTQVIYDEIR